MQTIAAISTLGHGVYLLCQPNNPQDPLSEIVDDAATYEASEVFATSLVHFILDSLLLYGIIKVKTKP